MSKFGILVLFITLLVIPLGIYEYYVKIYAPHDIQKSQLVVSSNHITPTKSPQSNLSYLLLTVDQNFSILVVNPKNQKLGDYEATSFNQIPNGSYYEEGIQDPLSEKSSPPLRSLSIKEPVNGSYKVTVSTKSLSAQHFSLEIFKYDIEGNATKEEITGDINKNSPKYFVFTYNQDK